MRDLIFVVKDLLLTRMMQSFDVFESFKFVGTTVKAPQEDTHKHLTAQEVLDRCVGVENERFAVVGVIIPEVGSAFVPNHKVISDGEKWCLTEDMCIAYNAKPE